MPLNSPTHDSEEPDASGKLYVVGTPIGNMEDITLRALAVLKQVDLVAAEDTRITQRLLSHYQLKVPLISYHEHNETRRAAELVEKLLGGARIALVSDAGMPGVSDPGYRLITAAIGHGIPVMPVPGVSAVTTAISVAGLPTDTFVFIGFPAKKKNRRAKQLEALSRENRTILFYESPRRIINLLEEIFTIMGDRPVVLAREMTKPYEEFIRGTISEILSIIAGRDQVKGECTLLVSGSGGENKVDLEAVQEEIRAQLKISGDGLSRISRRIADKYAVSRQLIYSEGLKIKEKK
jgi:16S rRNA (cytidine1402-2'-O)-methyltransferase